MEKKEAFALYEKLYFHEIDSREKLNSRLQTPLTLIVSFVGAFAFLLQSFKYQGELSATILFTILVITSFISLACATFYFVKSWYNNTYSFLPSAQDTEEYRQSLIKLYKPYSNGEQLASNYFSAYVMDYYVKYSSANTECNDRRSIYLHKTNGALVVTASVLFLAFLTFFFGNLDKANMQKPIDISIVGPVTLSGGNMPDPIKKNESHKEAPPPPPPPPPPRQIREGVEVLKLKDVTPIQQRGK